jgi:hypothetical protein
LLLGVTIAGQNLWIEVKALARTDRRKKARHFTHIASVWCGAVRYLGAHVSKPSHDFGHDSVLQYVHVSNSEWADEIKDILQG